VPGPAVAELLQGAVSSRVVRVGTLRASHRVYLFESRIWQGARRGRRLLRGTVLPHILQLGGQGAPQQADVVEAPDHGDYDLAVRPGALWLLLKAPDKLLEFGAGRVGGAGRERAAVGGGAPALAQELIQGRGCAQVDAVAQIRGESGFLLRARVH